ncbi:unnamed protein product [Mytilus edulis]|uniref:Uncharacterized protein n=1 Tax=Mytilus edulis TaxID=6550 RepID=A0A8S3V2Q9_MYTED|nr:unnamed protein product [Mytilus edulis]
MKERVLDLQCRSMKNNLVFTGLYNVRDENTEELLRCFLYNELGIDYKIEFGNVHRFGRYQGGGRPIVARFLYHCDLQYVLDNAYRLRNTRYGIKQQFPKEIEDRRRKLYPIMKEAKRNRKIATLVRDRLFIDNELYQNVTRYITMIFYTLAIIYFKRENYDRFKDYYYKGVEAEKKQLPSLPAWDTYSRKKARLHIKLLEGFSDRYLEGPK